LADIAVVGLKSLIFFILLLQEVLALTEFSVDIFLASGHFENCLLVVVDLDIYLVLEAYRDSFSLDVLLPQGIDFLT